MTTPALQAMASLPTSPSKAETNTSIRTPTPSGKVSERTTHGKEVEYKTDNFHPPASLGSQIEFRDDGPYQLLLTLVGSYQAPPYPQRSQQISQLGHSKSTPRATCPSGRLSRLIPIADPAASADSNPLQLIFQCMVPRKSSLAIQTLHIQVRFLSEQYMGRRLSAPASPSIGS